MGSAPDDYEKSPALQYELSKQSGLDVKHNNDKFKDRQEKLIQKGAFRIPMDREEWQRIDQPTFSGEVYKVQEGNAFIGSDVLDSTGKRHDSKVVLPVDKDSKNVEFAKANEKNARKRSEQRTNLIDYARQVLRSIPGVGVSITRFAQILNSMRGFKDTADAYDVPSQGRFIYFAKLFSNMFEVTGSGDTLRIRKAPPKETPSPAPKAAPSAPSELPRAPRLEIGPRAAYRLFPPDQPIRITGNSARPGSARFARVENYKNAKTFGEVKTLGGTSADISFDIEKGTLVIL